MPSSCTNSAYRDNRSRPGSGPGVAVTRQDPLPASHAGPAPIHPHLDEAQDRSAGQGVLVRLPRLGRSGIDDNDGMELGAQELIEVQDVAVLRWPHYASAPQAQEHVTDEGTRVSSLVSKLKHATIDTSMIESVKGDMMPGTSAVVLLSSDAAIDVVAKAFEGQDMELVRSDLSVQQQDRLRAAFGDSNPPAAGGSEPTQS